LLYIHGLRTLRCDFHFGDLQQLFAVIAVNRKAKTTNSILVFSKESQGGLQSHHPRVTVHDDAVNWLSTREMK